MRIGRCRCKPGVGLPCPLRACPVSSGGSAADRSHAAPASRGAGRAGSRRGTLALPVTTPAGIDPKADTDAELLGRLGYAQQLLRHVGPFQNFALSFSVISILTGAVTLYGLG